MQIKLDESSSSTNLQSDMTGKISNNIHKQLDRTSQNRTQAWRVATNIGSSFRYAAAGVTYAFNTQRNFRIHCTMGTIAISLGALLHLSGVEMAVICITSGLVLTLELLNTAIESVVDLTVQQTYHELAKVAKDCAAGAVLISALASVLVASWLILPKAILLLTHYDVW
jgi:diacylglycerol kinase (ATP)